MRKGSKERAFWNWVAWLPPLAGSVMVGRLLSLVVPAVLMIAPSIREWSQGQNESWCLQRTQNRHKLNMESDNGSTLGLAIVCIAIIQPKASPSTYPGSEGVGISQSEAGSPL